MHNSVHNAFSFYEFRLVVTVTLNKSYLSTYLEYLQNSFSIQKLGTCSSSSLSSSPQIAEQDYGNIL